MRKEKREMSEMRRYYGRTKQNEKKKIEKGVGGGKAKGPKSFCLYKVYF